MKLYEFTTVTNEDGSKVVSASGRISDHPDLALQKQHITFQIETALPIGQTGVVCRTKVLSQLISALTGIDTQFRSLVGEG